MIGFRQYKSMFFDRQAVMSRIDKASVKVLSKFGSFVRRRAQTSLKYKKSSSPPGVPATVHRTGFRFKTNKKTGLRERKAVSYLREYLFFGYDVIARSTVIGPAKLPGRKDNIPEVLEWGGRSIVNRGKNRTGVAQYEARPTMKLALAKEIGKLPALWANSVVP